MVLSVSAATCRVGDLFTAPTGGELIAGGTLDRSAPVGSIALVLGKIPVDNTGKGVLTWAAKVLGPSSWLSIQNLGGSSKTDSVRVMFNPAGLDTGTYEDSVSITSDVGGAGTVHVNWHIVDCDVKPIQAAGEEKSDTLTGADCGARHQTNTQAQFYGFIGNQGDIATVLLSSGTFNGFVALDTSLKPTVPALISATQCLGDTKNPCIYYFPLPSNATTYYIEVSGATTADTGVFDIRLISGSGRDPSGVQSLEQRLIPDSTQVVQIGGPVGASVLVHGVVSDSDVVDSMYLQAEWALVGTPFQGVIMSYGPYTHNGQVASVTLNGLQDNKAYHWQVRAVDQRGNFSSVGTNWDSLPRGSLPDFTVQIGHDPRPPTSLAQLQSDGSTAIPVGGNANTLTVMFSAQVSDTDAGDQLHIEVEVQPTDTAFGAADSASLNQTFTPVGNPGTALATIFAPTITDGKNYHWRARTVDNGGRKSPWVSFPTPTPNLESATDFHVAVQNNNNLVFTVQPPLQETAGIAMSPAVQVTAQDANGNTITGFTGNVTMTIANGPAGGVFSSRSTTVVQAVGGIANFTNLILTKVGSYTLQASAVFSGTTVLSHQSTPPTNVVPAPAKQLAFTAGPPASVQAGSPITPLQVSALDSLGNVASSFGGQITLAITSGTGKTGAHLVNPGPVTAVAGVATFTTAYIDSTGIGYTLTATATGPTSGTSTAFNITPGNATHLAFAVPPSNTAAASPITPAVQVAARDAFENTATSFGGNVLIAIGSNPSGGVLSSGTPNPATAVAGIAMFSSLSIDKLGTGYTLTAATTGLSTITSPSFNIVNSTVSPTNSIVSAASPITACQTGCNPGSGTASLITVTVKDVSGQPVSGATVVLSISGSNNTFVQPPPTNGSGITTTTLSSTLAEGKIVTAVANGVTIANPPTVTVNPGPVSSVPFTVQPSQTTAGVAISPAVQVTAKDTFGNIVNTFNGSVSVSIVAGPGGVFTLTSTTTVTAAAGVANFSNLHIQKAGAGYQLKASGAALTSLSNTFSVVVAPPFQLTFTTQPATTAIGAKIDSAIGGVVVTVQDSVGNTTPSFAGTVRIIPGVNPSGATLSGGGSISTLNGIAAFQNLTLNKLGSGYTLVTTSAGPSLASDESTPFDIIPGPAKSLAFKVQPSTAVAGVVMPAVTVVALDAFGDTATSFTGNNVTMSIGTNPSSGTLTGTTTVAASGGFATFSNLFIDKAGTPYTLTASSGALTPGTSTNFTVQPGGVSSTNSTVIASPSSITASSGSSTSTITVTARDAGNNVIAGAPVVLAISGTGNTTSPVSLNATTNGSGQAIWTLSSTVAESKTVSAVINSISINQTATVVVNPASPAVLVFTKQPPASVTAGVAIAPAVQVEVRDQFANKVTNASNQVTLSFIQTGRGPLTGNTATPSAGTATFASLTATQTTTALTPDSLLATATGLTPDTSTGFAVTPGVASKLAFLQNPTGATGGATISPPVTVEIEDANGNRVTSSTANVTLAITSGTGTAGAHLSGGSSVTVAASNGVATFLTLSVDSAGSNYTLSATSGALTGATSSAFNIGVGAASKLGFGVQPSSQNSATAISPAVTVRILDAGGNLTASGASVTVAITNGTGTSGAHLGGTVTAGASSGTAMFSTLTIDSAGTGYTLSATSGSLTGATSFAFSINVGPATKLGFRVQPNNPTGGVAFSPNVQVEVRDAGGNRVTSASTSIQLTLNGGDAAASLSGSNPVSAVSGLATFFGLSVDSAAASNYTLVATGGGLTQATSTPFTVTVGPAAKLGFHVQPTTTVAGVSFSPQVQVELQDAGGNRVATNGTAIVVAIANNPGGGTLGGNTSRNTASGLATYNNLSIDKTGTGYTLQATSGSLTPTTSLGFNITPAAADHLTFTVQPSTTQATFPITPAVEVEVRDQFENRVTSATTLVTIAIGNNPSSGTLSGTLSVNAVSGTASFSDLNIDNAGVNYSLTASAAGLTGATSIFFDIL